MNRRDFIKGTVASAALLAVSKNLVGATLNATGATSAKSATDTINKSKVVAVRGGEPVEMFRKAIDELGGISKFVKVGQKVVIKPNIAWDQPPEMGANTHPELVGEIVRQCLAAGASSVDVFDHTCNEWKSCYKNSQIQAAVENAGGNIHDGSDIKDYVDAEAPNAVKMKSAKIHKLVKNCDVLINVPVLKHHGGAQMTCAMKNYMGIVWDRGFMHKNDLHQSIADSVLFRPADLNIVDAYRVMKSGGPRGNKTSNIDTLKYLLVSTDIVAVDTLASKIIDFPMDKIKHIQLGEALQLGTSDMSKIDITRISMPNKLS